MREHDGIIKIESPLVKSMDEREIPEVALRTEAFARPVKSVPFEIFVDKLPFRPYNARQFKAFSEL
jgi:hypothetical protein